MFKVGSSVACLAIMVAGCTDITTGAGGAFIQDLPPESADLAGPNQDLTAVRFVPEDGCYWYRYKGPVETTMLPLRTKNGNPICAKKEA